MSPNCPGLLICVLLHEDDDDAEEVGGAEGVVGTPRAEPAGVTGPIDDGGVGAMGATAGVAIEGAS